MIEKVSKSTMVMTHVQVHLRLSPACCWGLGAARVGKLGKVSHTCGKDNVDAMLYVYLWLHPSLWVHVQCC